VITLTRCAVRMYVCVCANDCGVCVCIHKPLPEKIPEFFVFLVVSFRCAKRAYEVGVCVCVRRTLPEISDIFFVIFVVSFRCAKIFDKKCWKERGFGHHHVPLLKTGLVLNQGFVGLVGLVLVYFWFR